MKAYMKHEGKFYDACLDCTRKLLDAGMVESLGPHNDGLAFQMVPGVTLDQCREKMEYEHKDN